MDRETKRQHGNTGLLLASGEAAWGSMRNDDTINNTRNFCGGELMHIAAVGKA